MKITNKTLKIDDNRKEIWALSQRQEDIRKEFPNSNLLLNGNFKINQRGKTTYSANTSSYVYTVDRWCLAKRAGTTCTVGTRKVTIKTTNAEADPIYLQKIDNPTKYAGQTVTFSVRYNNLKGSIGIRIYDGQKWPTTTAHTKTSGTISLTFAISSNNTALSCEILKMDSGTTFSVDLLEAKLEIGEVATKFTERQYDEELALCKNYYLKLEAKSSYTIFGTGLSYTQSRAFITINASMRSLPTMSYGGAISVLNANGYNATTSLAMDNYSDACICIIANGSSFQVGQAALLSSQKDSSAYIEFDAEIY